MSLPARSSRIPSRSRRTRPPGGVYIAVLGVSALVLVLGLGGLASARAIVRTQSEARDLSGARWAALSGLELGRYAIEENPLWRSQRSAGAWFSNIPLGSATVTVTASNPNGAFNRMPTDPIVLTATAQQGSCTHVAQLTLDADATGYSSLDIPLTAGGAIGATSATVHASGYTIATNNAFTALLCTINANVDATLTAIGLTVNGTARSLIAARSMPGSNAFDYYLANGTAISIGSLPISSTRRVLANGVLAPSSNPFGGGFNAQGIYVIDAGNQKVSIGPCRIVGTLVIINANGPVILQSTIISEPGVSNFPCIMIRGDATISSVGSTYAENATSGNLNPAGTPYPYPGGVSNATTTDSFDSAINGLVYVSGAVTVSDSPVVNQLIAGGGVTLGGTLTLGYTSEYRRNPPPGFSVIRMRPRQGDRKQVAP